MTSKPVLQADLALLEAAEKVLESVTGLPPVVEAIDKALEAIIQAEINIIKREIPCYMRGTLITTEAGDVAVEDIKVGDLVATVSGKFRPVVWIGHRSFDVSKHPHPQPLHIHPVLVRANAFGENRPARDLWLSPGHNVFVDEVLIPIQSLINGISIVRQPLAQFEYWHVELDEHDVIIAEGLFAESFLDTGNRAAFVDGAAYLEQHPDFGPRHSNEACAPIFQDGPKWSEVHQALSRRTEASGYALTDTPELHLTVDHMRVDPIDLGDKRFAFIVPPGSKDVTLASRTFTPAESEPANGDFRALGVCVAELQINGKLIDLGNDEQFGDGWHKLERWNDETHRRWTKGLVSLPSDTRLLTLQLDSPGRYLVRDPSSVIRLVA